MSIPLSVQRHWLSGLTTRWHRVNEERLDGRLRPPQFALDQATTRLGRWEATSRTIGIGVEHLLTATWLEVDQTLRHEMAHQIVSEMFGAEAAQPHGALFRRACRLVGCESAASATQARSPEMVRTVERIRKLMNLSQSPNSHEAAAAMATANRLLLTYNLELSDTDEPSSRPSWRWVGEPTGRVTLERKLLAGLLQDFFFVQCVWIRTARARDGKRVSVLELLARDENLDLAEYVHTYLVRTLDSLWDADRKRRGGGGGNALRNEFRIGVLFGFREHLEAQRETHREEGLVWLGDPAVDDLLASRYPRLRSMGRSTYRLGDAHQRGRSEGRRIRIRPGVGSTSPRKRGRLLPAGRDS